MCSDFFLICIFYCSWLSFICVCRLPVIIFYIIWLLNVCILCFAYVSINLSWGLLGTFYFCELLNKSVNTSPPASDETFKKLIRVFFCMCVLFYFLKSGINRAWKSSCGIRGSRQNVSIVDVVSNSMDANFILLDIWIVSTCLRTHLLASVLAISFRVIDLLPVCIRPYCKSYMLLVQVFFPVKLFSQGLRPWK